MSHSPSTRKSVTPVLSSDDVSSSKASDLQDVLELDLPEIDPGFTPLPSSDLRGHRPMMSEMAAAKEAVLELDGATDWESVFGITAPDAATLAEQLQMAVRWSTQRMALMKLVAFVKSEEGKCWKDALTLVEALKVPFELAAAADPARMQRFSALARLLRAQKLVGKRAAAQRARNLKAKKEAPDAPTEVAASSDSKKVSL